MKSIIILSGPIGAGKTTVAKALVASSNGPAVYIEGDKFWFFIAKGHALQSDKKDFKTIMVSMTVAAVPYATAGYEVILDFSMPPWFLDTAERLAKIKEVPLDYVVLRPSMEVCQLRAAARSEGAIKDYTLHRELYLSFDEAAPHTISDDTGSADIVAETIREGIREGKFRLS
jgi:adenylate kinase family enzyme